MAKRQRVEWHNACSSKNLALIGQSVFLAFSEYMLEQQPTTLDMTNPLNSLFDFIIYLYRYIVGRFVITNNAVYYYVLRLWLKSLVSIQSIAPKKVYFIVFARVRARVLEVNSSTFQGGGGNAEEGTIAAAGVFLDLVDFALFLTLQRNEGRCFWMYAR